MTKKNRRGKRYKPSTVAHRPPAAERRPPRAPIDIDETLAWYAACTGPRQELGAAAELEEAGVAYYLPTQHQKVSHARRIIEAERAVFSGYLFFGFPPGAERFRTVLEADGVRSVVSFAGRPVRLRARLLIAVEKRLRLDAAARERREEVAAERRRKRLPSHRMKVGDSARVRDGLFEGLFAVIEKLLGPDRALVLLSTDGEKPQGNPISIPVEHLAAA